MAQPHIKLSTGQVRSSVIVVGDPARAEALAKSCESCRELAYNREYRSFDCLWKGKYFTVVSHGVGSAGAAIAFEELIKCGAKVIFRAGTCGSLQPDKIGQGDLILATACVREDGASQLMVPLGFPAVADPETVIALEQVVKEKGAKYSKGIVVTSDLFYPSVLPSTLEMYSKANVEGVEMEAATLYVIASLRGVRAAAFFTVDGSPLKWDKGDYDPHGAKVQQGKKNMLEIAVEAAARLSTCTKPLP